MYTGGILGEGVEMVVVPAEEIGRGVDAGPGRRSGPFGQGWSGFGTGIPGKMG